VIVVGLDMLLEQILVGPSPNLQLLSYLRHAVDTQVGIVIVATYETVFFKLLIFSVTVTVKVTVTVNGTFQLKLQSEL